MLLRRGLLRLSAAASGGVRRSLTGAAASHPRWAMMVGATAAVGGQSASVRLAEPPQVSDVCVPEHLIKTRGSPDPASGVLQDISGGIRAVSGDGLLLLTYLDLRFVGKEDEEPTGLDPAHVPSVTRFICNPVTGELSRLPVPYSIFNPVADIVCGRHTGLITQADRGHGPPDRFAVTVLQVNQMVRFLSRTGAWEIVEVSPCRRPPSRRLRLCQEAVAFGGRLWWADVSWGAISADPFSDRPELSFVQLPSRSVLPECTRREALVRYSYRRVGVSQGRLRYVEVSQEEPYLLSSFVLDDEGSSWTLEHRVVLNKIWGSEMSMPLQMRGATKIVHIDPLNASIVYLKVMSRTVAMVDMEREEVIETCLYSGDDAPCMPCVLPPWLGSSRIPSAGKKGVEKNNTLADVLVRSDNH